MTHFRIDSGLSQNNFLDQLMADMLDVEVKRSTSIESTGLGSAQIAGLYCGFWSMEDLKNSMTVDKIFTSSMSNDQR